MFCSVLNWGLFLDMQGGYEKNWDLRKLPPGLNSPPPKSKNIFDAIARLR